MRKPRVMVLLTYNLNKNVNPAEYEQWARDVDNPFFNSVPGIVRYENWKVLEEKLGEVSFKYYDLMEIEGEEAFDKVMGNADLQKFVQGWVEKWSVHGPDPKFAPLNFQIVTANIVAEPAVD